MRLYHKIMIACAALLGGAYLMFEYRYIIKIKFQDWNDAEFVRRMDQSPESQWIIRHLNMDYINETIPDGRQDLLR